MPPKRPSKGFPTSGDFLSRLGISVDLPSDAQEQSRLSNPESPVDEISAEEVKKRRDELVPRILQHWTTLKGIVLRHEATIQRRWVCKSEVKRRVVLAAAWPGMSKRHQGDFAAYMRSHEIRVDIDDPDTEDMFLMPYMNVEDLSKPEPLTIMLNSRARNPPTAFVSADVAGYCVGSVTRTIHRPHLGKWIMMFNGGANLTAYAKLYNWDDHPEALRWFKEYKGLAPADGLNCLKIQERIYSFLVECCLLILHDHPRDSVASSVYPVTDEPPSLSANDNETGITSLRTSTFESSYRLPSKLNLARLEAVVAAQLAEFEDEIWNLREDPEVFACAIFEAKEHMNEMIPDRKGNPQPALHHSCIQSFWEKVVFEFINTKLRSWYMWHYTLEVTRRLRHLMDKHKDSIRTDQDLPKELADGFCELWALLDFVERCTMCQLEKCFCGSPGVRKYFDLQPRPEDPGQGSKQMTESPKYQMYLKACKGPKPVQLLLYLMFVLNHNKFNNGSRRFPTYTLLETLDHLVQKEPSVNARLSSRVRRVLGELTIVTECLQQLRRFLPWAQGLEAYIHKTQETQESCIVSNGESGYWIQDSQTCRSFAKYGIPTDGRFRYPAGKKPTKENVEQMRSAEAALDEVWSVYLRGNARLLHPHLKDLLVNCEPHRTEPYVELESAPAVATKKKKNDNKSATDASLGAPFGGLILAEQRIAPAAPLKTKVKTRGVADPAVDTSSSDELLAEPEAVAEEKREPFRVDKRSIKVFDVLFFSSDPAERGAREIHWVDFVHAMVQMGFSAETLYGSAWRFAPTSTMLLGEEKSFQAHEPHPSSKLTFWEARVLGRRLGRKYGWDRSMFVQA